MVLKFFKNTFIIITLVCIGYSPIFYFNIYEDPYSIFTSDFSNRRIEPNSHFIKMRFLTNNKTNFDSFIFGNSRANNVNPKLFNNGNYFNLYYSLGIPKEYLEDIKILIRNNKEIKNIIIFLDFSSYSTNIINREKEMLRTPYTDNKVKLLKKYINYCFQIPSKQFKKEYYQAIPSAIYLKMYETGQAENKEAENFIENNKQVHINDPKFNYPSLVYENLMNETIIDIDDIKKLCRSKKINLIFVMNPIHKVSYLASNRELYYQFIKRLSDISNFYDFSGVNKVTSNNYFYYETSHYRPIIGNAMVNFIQNKKQIDTIPDFGSYISKQNIEQHISHLKSQ